MDNHEDFEWNDIYTGNASDYMEPDAELLELIDELPPGRALDIGCGSGGLVVALLERGWKVSGVDIAPKAIEAAGKLLDARGLKAELSVADAADWQPEGSFDLITNSFALPATQEEQARLFRTIREALRPGGRVLIKDFDAAMKAREEFARFHCPTVDELVAAFDGFEVTRAEVRETPAHDHGEEHRDEAGAPARTAATLYARKGNSRAKG
jgi:SAM-dependent methyltransferase